MTQAPAAAAGIDMHHALLSIAFPEFRFGYQPRASWPPRWVAVRKDIRMPGVHTVVTDDLDELLVLLGKAVVLMLPPWGILPPRDMMTRGGTLCGPRPRKTFQAASDLVAAFP